jgi:hypothetical protein
LNAERGYLAGQLPQLFVDRWACFWPDRWRDFRRGRPLVGAFRSLLEDLSDRLDQAGAMDV